MSEQQKKKQEDLNKKIHPGKKKKIKKHNYNTVLWEGKPRNFLGLPLNFTTYIITENRLVTSKGFFNIHEDEIVLYRVVDKSLKLSLGQRIFACGSIVIHVKDSDTPEKIIKSVRHPRKVFALLDQVVENAKTKHKVHGTDMYGAMSGGGESHTMHIIDGDGDGIPDVFEK